MAYEERYYRVPTVDGMPKHHGMACYEGQSVTSSWRRSWSMNYTETLAILKARFSDAEQAILDADEDAVRLTEQEALDLRHQWDEEIP